MKLLLILILAGCTSEPSAPPDVATPQPVHDMLLTGCDQGWSTAAGSAVVTACASACIQMPDCTPNGRKFGRPCDDLPACPAARDHDASNNPIGPSVACGATFVANDSTGGHLGCCMLTSPTSETVSAHFFECVGSE